MNFADSIHGLPLLAQSASNAALVTFLIYIAAVFGLAYFSNKLLQTKSFLSEYFLGSRSLGVWAFALTFAATSASGGSFTGFPSKIYTHGWILGLWIGSYIVVPICAMGLLGKRINQVARISGAITVPDVLRDRFHSPLFGLLAVSLIVFFMAFNLVAQFKSGSEILRTLLQDVEVFNDTVGWIASVKGQIGFLRTVDSAYLLCLVTFAVAVIVYTTYGGFHAVVWTDVMQGIVMVVGVLIMLPLAISQVGGLMAANEKISQMTPPRVGMARFELRTPAEKDLAMHSPWFTLPGEEAAHPRLFRVSRTLTIPAGRRVVNHVKYVEITTPAEITAQLARLASPREIAPFNAAIKSFKQDQIEWLRQHGSEREQEQIAVLEREIEAVDSNDVALLNAPQLNLFDIHLTLNKSYRFGAGQTGMYISGPGPDPPSLPSRPAALAVELEDEEVDLRIFDDANNLIAERRGAGPGVAHFSLDSQKPEEPPFRLRAAKAGVGAFEQRFSLSPGATETIAVALTDSPVGAVEDAPLTSAAPRSSDGFLPLSIAISFFFMWAISGAGQPSSMVRLMAFKNTTTLRRSIFTVAIYYSMIYFPLVIIFVCARVLLPGMDLESDRIMPQMAVTLTSNIGQGWLAGLLVAAPFAAVMSTVDSFLLMISSALVRDIYQRNINPRVGERSIKYMSYFFTLLVGAGAMLGAVNPPQFLQDIIVYTGSGLAACFLAPMVFALYWPRANSAGCIAGMVAGFGAHLAMYVAGSFIHGSFYSPYELWGFNPIIIGLGVSFIAVIVVTLVTPPPPEEIVRKYFYKSK